MSAITYIWGQDRNSEHVVAHAYECEPGDTMAPLRPLCWRGWNRQGVGFSIFRGVVTGGECRICQKRRQEGRAGVPPKARKTRWL